MAFKKMLEAIMSVVSKIQDKRYGVKPTTAIKEFVNKYNIDNSIIQFDGIQEQLLLCHVQHLYEIVERTQIKSLLDYLKLVNDKEKDQ